jgi:hypothetical protein
MALITSTTSTLTAGQVGDIARSGDVKTISARASATELIFGRMAIRGASDGLVILPAGTAAAQMGIVMRDQNIEPTLLTSGDVPAGQSVSLLRKGTIWVLPEVDVTQGAAVYYRHANAGSAPEALGAFRDDNDSASGDVTLVPNAVWASSGTAGNLCALEVNFP